MFNYQEILGSYSPQFMYIELFSDNEDTMIHEYVHFLQNISTNFGIEQYTFLRKIFSLNIVENITSQSLWNNQDVRDSYNIFVANFATNSHVSFNDVNILNIVFNDNSTIMKKFSKKVVSTAIIEMEVDGSNLEYIFNVRTIIENMARIIQRHCFPDRDIPKSLDYDICEPIIKKYYPSFPATPQNIVALCDLSLSSDYPVNHFFLMLSVFRNAKFKPMKSKEIYEYIEKYSGYSSTDGKHYTYQETFKDKIDSCFEEIENLYSKNDVINDINAWLKETFLSAYKIRLSNRNFISELLDYPAEKTKKLLNLYMQILDIPLTILHDKQVVSGPKKENCKNLLLLRAEKEIFNCICKGSETYQCGMKEICTKNGDNIITVDGLCNDAILKTDTYKDDEYACPFALLWTKWGLKRNHIL